MKALRAASWTITQIAEHLGYHPEPRQGPRRRRWHQGAGLSPQSHHSRGHTHGDAPAVALLPDRCDAAQALRVHPD